VTYRSGCFPLGRLAQPEQTMATVQIKTMCEAAVLTV
jgi:hypothetical protein